MTSKERVRRAIAHQRTDRVPAAFEAVDTVVEKLLKHYGDADLDALRRRYEIDIVPAEPRYIGPELTVRLDAQGREVRPSWWGFDTTMYATQADRYGIVTRFPLAGVDTLQKLDAYAYPDPDWFDYSALRQTCDQYPDKAVIIGHEGPFQIVTFLMEMDEFFMLMVDEPEVAKAILDRMVDFELEYYRRCFEAAPGKIDILRPHDDYGTQISMLFSAPMWREFFRENTKRLTELAHRYGAFYQQHSCGAVGELIPEFIECGVDVLEPLQKVRGLEVETLARLYGGKIAFHGGVDTQGLLPFGTAEQVRTQTERIIRTLGANGGYILMASQSFESDVPLENIEAVYAADRTGGMR